MNGIPAPVWAAIGFLSGSVPFSAILVRLFCGRSIATVGDGNPGAANAFKAGGWPVGAPALLLDFAKAAVPVTAAHYGDGVAGWWLAFVAAAPVCGHAFSPFLRGRGGKAVTATLGMWTGLTLWMGPVFLGSALTVLWRTLDSDAWAAVLGAAAVTVVMAAAGQPAPVVAAGALATLLIAFKQGRLLATPPRRRRRPPAHG
ncbi:MAG: glycerol-3-phosphate acyltransferase [Acidobacteria bacterium]|nr:glycerol-3-phosphate acyltransferase [Acidobacteriota bacterium]